MKRVIVANHKLSPDLMFPESGLTESVLYVSFVIQTCVSSSSPSTG